MAETLTRTIPVTEAPAVAPDKAEDIQDAKDAGHFLIEAANGGEPDQPAAAEQATAELAVPEDLGELIDKALIESITVENVERNDYMSSKRAADHMEDIVNLSIRTSDLLDLAKLRHEGQTAIPDKYKELDELYKDATPTELYDLAEQTKAERQKIIVERSKQSDQKLALETARTNYVKNSKGRSKDAKERRQEAETEYNDAFVEYLSSIMDITDREAILQAGYIPETVLRMQDKPTGLEKYSGEQLHLLVNELTRENLRKAKAIEDSSNVLAKRAMRAIRSNRGLRIAIGGAIWAGSTMEQLKDFLPPHLKPIGEVFGTSLQLVGGYVAARETLNSMSEGLDSLKKKRQLKQDVKRIASDGLLTDSALAILYNDVEHTNTTGRMRMPGSTEADNAELISAEKVNKQYDILDNAPGGKPYKAERIMPYVTDLLLRKKDLIDDAMNSDDPKTAFLELARLVVTEDTQKLSKSINESTAKRMIFRAAALAASILVSQLASRWTDSANGITDIPDNANSYLRPEMSL